MGQTIEIHFLNLPEPERTEAFEKLWPEKKDEVYESLKEALMAGFYWGPINSPERAKWIRLYNSLT